MSKKLLNKTLNTYLLFSLLLMGLLAIVFYFGVQYLYIVEADEMLRVQKAQFKQLHESSLATNQISTWNTFNDEIKIEAYNGQQVDLFSNSEYYNNVVEETIPLRVLQTPIEIEGKNYTLNIRFSLVLLEDLLLSTVVFFMMLLLLLLLGFYLITRKVSASLWSPFYKTLSKLQGVSIDSPQAIQFDKSDIQEFNQLNDDLEKLVQRNATIYRNQREFVENAAHELQTPLAIFKAQIDSFLQRADVNEEQAQMIESLQQSATRLSNLNKNLLLLSKLETQVADNKESINMTQLLQDALPFFTEQAQQKQLKINTNINENVIWKGNRSQAEILMRNLLINAISHNIANGEIQIRLDKNIFSVSNTGSPEILDQEKLFLRFATTKEQGNGLGLAIVQKIATLNHWRVDYSFTESLHTFSMHC